MRIFGIDPGSVRTGYGCVETDGTRHRLVACGVVSGPSRASFPDRLRTIHDGLLDKLRAAIKGAEKIGAGERCLYAWYPDGIGESKLTVKLIERHLGAAVTGRNWNTILKLAEM